MGEPDVIAVVLAAGEGTRLLPVTRGRPKALLEVGGRSILVHCLEALATLEPDRIVVVVGRRKEQIASAVGGHFAGIPIDYAEQPEASGSADAILAAAAHLGAAEEIVVMNGDNVFAADLRPVLLVHRAEGHAATLLVERLSPERAVQGICRLGAAGRVVGLTEHPSEAERQTGVVSAGFYVFSSRILDACRRVAPSANGEREISEAINLLIEEGHPVGASGLDGWRVNVNRAEDLEVAERKLGGGGQLP
ncbi:MAG: sugar phosphate nucleotidyltransferase [Gemmatimonadetes bacterium]|nr:sugar phosphate nucleotidyltransferase [Gemmatimonadota bacterium]